MSVTLESGTKALAPGTPAPAFKLKSTPDQYVTLNEFKGKNLVIVFYPADFSPVCTDELGLYNELLQDFKKHNAEVIGISCDGVWSHVAFKEQKHLHISLLSDFHPHGKVAKEYGVFKGRDGICERALFVIDKSGIIRWSYVSPEGVNPGADDLLVALDNLSKDK